MADVADNSDAGGVRRVDRWLWSVRVFKTRPLATEACRGGRVQVNELPAKPAREVRAGEIVTIRLEGFARTLRVVAIPRSRVGAKSVGDFCVDLTSPEELERQRRRSQAPAVMRELGRGRPTKRDRRQLDRLLGYSG